MRSQLLQRLNEALDDALVPEEEVWVKGCQNELHLDMWNRACNTDGTGLATQAVVISKPKTGEHVTVEVGDTVIFPRNCTYQSIVRTIVDDSPTAIELYRWLQRLVLNWAEIQHAEEIPPDAVIIDEVHRWLDQQGYQQYEKETSRTPGQYAIVEED